MAIVHIVLFEWKSTASQEQIDEVGRHLVTDYHTIVPMLKVGTGMPQNARAWR
jgi:hypothetical protein